MQTFTTHRLAVITLFIAGLMVVTQGECGRFYDQAEVGLRYVLGHAQ